MKFRIPEVPKVDAKKVGIQLPDGLKRYAIDIAAELEKRGYEVLISGESCFGACDVDLRLLEEVDVLLHFGHTPVVEVERVVYVPVFIDYNPKIELNVPERRLSLIATAQYCHRLEEVKLHLEERDYAVELRKGSNRVVMKGQVLGCNYTALRGSESEAILFIGDGLFHAKGAAMYTGKKVYAYNPHTSTIEEIEASDFLRERNFQVSRCVGKKSAGIIVSSKPGQRRMKLAEKLKQEAMDAGIRADIVYLNDVTPEKLYNLPYDFYINTACPRITYDDFMNFDRPFITPSEFEFLIKTETEIEVDEIE